MAEVLQTNTIGPARVSQAFLPLVERGGKKTIVNISSTMGSIGSDLNRGQMSYCISKTALNMLVRLIHLLYYLTASERDVSRGYLRHTSKQGLAQTLPSSRCVLGG